MKRIKRENIFLILVLCLGAFLRFYRIFDLAVFIGDQGRDYLAARDIIVNHRLTFIGPQTSIPWLYLGPFFYYFLAFFLLIGNFNPIWPFYGTAFFGVLAIYLIYVLGRKLFDERVGLLAAFFYAISPYAILQSRISLHPSILPVFVILFLIALLNFFTVGINSPRRSRGRCLAPHRLVQGLATVRGVFGPFFLTFSFLTAVQLHFSAILLLPIAVLAWEQIRLPKSIRLIRLFLAAASLSTLVKIYRDSPFTPISYWWKMFLEIFSYGNNFGGIIALAIVTIGVIRVIRKRGGSEMGPKILVVSLLVIVCGLTIKNSPAEHPYNFFLPVIILIFSFGLNKLANEKFGKIFLFVIPAFFLVTNYQSPASLDGNQGGLITSNYFSKIYGPGLSSRIKLAEFIVNDSGGSQFTLKRCGPLWDYPSTNMNYEYLVWWLSSKSKRQSKSEGKKVIYYIFEPREAWETKEGCEKVGERGGEIFEFEQARVLKIEE